MDFQPNLEQTLCSLQAGHLSVEDALEQINGVKELGYAAIDTDRQRRNGFPEVVYGEGKTVEQIEGILQFLSQKELPILTTRVSHQKGGLFLSAFRLATIIRRPAASFSTLKRKKPILNTTLRSSQQGQVMFLLQKKLQSLQKPLAIRFAESMMWESPASIASSIA